MLKKPKIKNQKAVEKRAARKNTISSFSIKNLEKTYGNPQAHSKKHLQKNLEGFYKFNFELTRTGSLAYPTIEEVNVNKIGRQERIRLGNDLLHKDSPGRRVLGNSYERRYFDIVNSKLTTKDRKARLNLLLSDLIVVEKTFAVEKKISMLENKVDLLKKNISRMKYDAKQSFANKQVNKQAKQKIVDFINQWQKIERHYSAILKNYNIKYNQLTILEKEIIKKIKQK